MLPLTTLPDLSALTDLAADAQAVEGAHPDGVARPVGARVVAEALTRSLQTPARGCPTVHQRRCRPSTSVTAALLTSLPDLSAFTSLQTLDLRRCNPLTSLPNLLVLTSLQTLDAGWLQIPHDAARPVGAHRPRCRR